MGEQGEVGCANVWKTQGGAVRSLTNIYSLIVIFLLSRIKKNIKLTGCAGGGDDQEEEGSKI